jgi:hypothetical protein
MAIVAGFGLFLYVAGHALLSTILSLHAKIVLASSIFYISPVKEEAMKKTAVNHRLKHEFGTRFRLRAPSTERWLCCRAAEQMKFVDEAAWKIKSRLDLGKFLYD